MNCSGNEAGVEASKEVCQLVGRFGAKDACQCRNDGLPSFTDLVLVGARDTELNFRRVGFLGLGFRLEDLVIREDR